MSKLDDLLQELANRQRRPESVILGEAAAEILRLHAQVRARGRLLQDIFNHPDVQLPPELNRRVDRTLMFGEDTQEPKVY